jgi:hypothetical protein
LLFGDAVNASFVLMNEDSEGSMYIDKETIRRSGDTIRFWQRHTYKSPQNVKSKKVDTYQYDTTILCSSRRVRIHRFVTYYQGKKVSEGTDRNAPAHAFPPGSY